jgi:SNF2 family DNA or RNA helicase
MKAVRVFLISLKAGGVGLNLTAADYVYIVDPWWNPAVEQQAIDRTHRIGQDKNIFAYRMICVDTIEDKIIQLQEKKRALAKDLIADDSTFVKSLTREDVEYCLANSFFSSTIEKIPRKGYWMTPLLAIVYLYSPPCSNTTDSV